MSQAKKSASRRTFLVGLLTGAGAAVALGTVPRKVAARKKPARVASAAGPILYRRTKDIERYYKTLYT
jgi:Rieske Fe-S protein